jgi:DNA-binding transcriptional LysR family regulator
MPELGHLRAFIAVAEERNFTRAAQRLHLAQQAVSKSVATLESQLGVKLLRRTTRDVSLTAAGETLLRSGSDALQRVDAAFAEASAHGHALTGTLHVGVTPAARSRRAAAPARTRHRRQPGRVDIAGTRAHRARPVAGNRHRRSWSPARRANADHAF